MTTYRAHIFKHRQVGGREEIRLKLFDENSEPINLGATETPSAVYTSTLTGITSDNADDVVVSWDAAPTYDPDTFDLTDEQAIRVKRSGVYRISFFGEIGTVSIEDFWALRLNQADPSDFNDMRWWAWTTFDRPSVDGNDKVGSAMHMEAVFATPGAAVLPVTLDFNVFSSPPQPLPTTALTAFPQRLSDAPDFSGDNWIPYYLPLS